MSTSYTSVNRSGAWRLTLMAGSCAAALLMPAAALGADEGVGLADFNPNNTPTAAVFYDEFYLSSNALGGIGLFDVGRIEVLKGPQGGLYGRNTSGGATRIISQEPQLGVLGGYADASYGSWGRFVTQGAINVPFGDIGAFRLSGMVDQGGGWQDSLATPEDDSHGDEDFYAVRGQLLIEPSDTFRVLFKAEAGADKSETALGVAIGSETLAVARGFCVPIQAGMRDQAACGTWAEMPGRPVSAPIASMSKTASTMRSSSDWRLQSDS